MVPVMLMVPVVVTMATPATTMATETEESHHPDLLHLPRNCFRRDRPDCVFVESETVGGTTRR
jgi:hypothetical protein